MNFSARTKSFEEAVTLGELPKQRRRSGAVLIRMNCLGETQGSPVELGRRRRRLSSVMKRHRVQGRPFVVSLHKPGGTLRPDDASVRMRGQWSESLVGPNDIVLVTELPAGGQLGMALAMLALTVVAMVVTGPFGLAIAGTIWGTVVTAGIVMGGGYLLSLAMQPKADKADDTRPLYGVSGGGNLPRPGDRIPALYGEAWTQPDLSQPDYTVYDGEDMLLYKRVTVGLGKHEILEIHLGSAVLWRLADGVVAPFAGALGGTAAGEIGAADSFGGGASSSGSGAGTEVEIINPGETSDLVPATVYSSPSVSGTELPRFDENPAWAGPFPVCPVGTTTSRIQLDFAWPRGIFDGRDGQEVANASYQWQYAPCDDDNEPTGAWQVLFDDDMTIKSTQPQRFTRIIDVADGRYIVRGQNEQSELLDDEGDPEIYINDVTWDGLRAHFPDEIVRPHVTEIALKVRSGKSLGVTAFGDLWVKYRRILPTWNGSSWVDAPTRKSVYAFLDIMRSTYGGALSNAEVDLERVKTYAAALSTFDTFDGMIRGPVSIWEAAAVVLGPMRAEPTRIGRTWSLRRDEAQDIRKHTFTRRQILRDSSVTDLQIACDQGESDVVAEYLPDGDPRRRRDLRVTFGAQSLTPSRMQIAGVSSWEHAHHIATWKAAAAFYRRETRTFNSNRQGRLVSRGDTIVADMWFMSEVRTAGIQSRSGNNLTLDTDVVFDGPTYARLRDRKGQEWGPVLCTAGAAANKIVLDAGDVATVEVEHGALTNVIGLDDEEMTTVEVGPITEMETAYLIKSVQPQGKDTVAIEAVIDAPEVYEALGEEPPTPPTLPSQGDEVEPTVAVIAWVRAKAIQRATGLVMEWAVSNARGAASYVVQITYDAGASWEKVYDGIATSGSHALDHLEGSAVKVGAYAVHKNGSVGPAVYAEFETFKPELNDTNVLVNLTAFETESLNYITQYLGAARLELKKTIDKIATLVSRQDALNFTDRQEILREISVQKGSARARFTEVISVMANADAALAQQITTLAALVVVSIDEVEALIAAEIQETNTAFANADAALAQQDVVLAASVTSEAATRAAAIQATNTAFANADAALAQQDVVLAASVTSEAATRAAAVQATNTAFANADTALAQADVALSAAITNETNARVAAIQATNTAFANADSALAQQDVVLAASVTSEAATRAAAVQATNTAFANADAALAQTDNNLSASIASEAGTRAAAISSVQSAYAAADAVIASSVTTLTANFNNYTAGIKARFVVGATPEGASAMYELLLNVNDAVAGQQIVLLPNGTSYIRLDSTRLLIGKSDQGGFYPFFTFDSGEGRHVLNVPGGAIAAGDIGSGQIGVSTISEISPNMGTFTAGRVILGGKIDIDGSYPRILVSD